ncbi:hypothetical protein CERSUDRAFT_156746 [Gelatoporia subvermispora B]|uniref:Uncharacterized protein n=1 Tax=Ceriporiopsis subvermispora (strain B) TaxID=914234 RepID=M2PIL6_CERS8|nr:hypothetical protein CERSUDRAFT_156746 [Gelatoporia subvermispora B]
MLYMSTPNPTKTCWIQFPLHMRHSEADMLVTLAMNSETGTTNVVLAMCFTQNRSSASSSTSQSALQPGGSKPAILMVSLQKVDWLDSGYSQLYSGLRKNAIVSEILTVRAAKRAMASSKPSAILVTDSTISKPAYSDFLKELVAYTRAGGRVILGAQFSSYFQPDQGPRFFSQWGMPTWDIGSYHHTVFALNPAGIPPPLDPATLFPEYSIKAVLIRGAPRDAAVYLPSPSSRVQSNVFPNVKVTGAQLEESPALWARVGDGFLGYIGDVNGEQASIRLMIEMCGVKIKSETLGRGSIWRASASRQTGRWRLIWRHIRKSRF